MKAIVHHKYGSPDVLELREIDKPGVTDDEVLVRVHASSVNPAEWYAMTGLFVARMGAGLLKPKNTRLGVDFAGVVEAVGGNVKQFRPGDEVFGGRNGAFAEYVCVREDRGVALKPANVTLEQAAAVPTAALTALQGLRDHGQIQPGQQVLINGASGGVGTFAVQIAKSFGAEVTGVCSTRNVDLVRSLGADHVVDYTQEDFTRSERRYDLLLDIAGSRSWSACKRVLNPKAIFVIVGGPKTNRWIGPLSHVIKVRLASLQASQKVIFFVAKLDKADLVVLQELIEAGKVTPVIDRQYELRELPEAMRYLGAGHAWGKVVITLGHNSKT
jgi:NADPH:quinone reductase-like Zn-dependent oxidoreductase